MVKSGSSRRKICDSVLEVVRSTRATARPGLADGGSLKAELLLQAAKESEVGRSKLFSGNVISGIEIIGPGLVCSETPAVGPGTAACCSSMENLPALGGAGDELYAEAVKPDSRGDESSPALAESRPVLLEVRPSLDAAGLVVDCAMPRVSSCSADAVSVETNRVDVVADVNLVVDRFAAGPNSEIGVTHVADKPCIITNFASNVNHDGSNVLLGNAKSYAATVCGRLVSDPMGADNDDAMDDLDYFTDADVSYVPGRCGLNLKFSKRVLDALDRNWRYAVIVNLMGKPNSVNVYEFILRGLRKKWRSSGCWKLIDLPKDYFVVNFELEEDMVKALCDGPWVLGGHTLIVRRWCATFNPLTDLVRSMAIWARVEGLPLRYFTEFAMTKVGKLIGEEVVKVDNVTTQKDRGQYGRVCVEIDLNKPLKTVIEVEDVLYKVRYEGLDHLCFMCGMYGHVREDCMVGKVQMADDSECGEVPKGSKEEEMNVDIKEVVDDGFGPWMIMDYKTKRRNGKVSETKAMSSMGSRFSVLDVEDNVRPQKATPLALIAKDTTSVLNIVPGLSDLKKVTRVQELAREDPSWMSSAPPLDLSNAPPSKIKGSAKLTKRLMVSRARDSPPTPHPSSKSFGANPDLTKMIIPGLPDRSPLENSCVLDEAPTLGNGVKGIVAHFEGADATLSRDSSFPFCSSSHAG